MKPKVYIDGHAGTTGLRIRSWLGERSDIELLTLPEAVRKDDAARREQFKAAEVAVLCLPDDAARQAAQWAEGHDTRLLDASTAHRVAEGWVYGLPELTPQQRSAIGTAKLVSNPGCYATGFLLAVRPLVENGLLRPDAPLSIHALSGYTGGGRQMIEKWEDKEGDLVGLHYEAPYAVQQNHKHLPEMHRYSGLESEPYFLPAVGPFPCGMRLEIPLRSEFFTSHKDTGRVFEVLQDRYAKEPFVRVVAASDSGLHEHSFDPMACNASNRIELHVASDCSGHILLVALLDNLGKGAAGAAIQNLNLMLGLEEGAGLPR